MANDDQKYKIDIEKIYSSIIQQIDNIRSNVSIANNSAQLKSFIKSANTTNPSKKSILSQVSTDVNNVQESRCHAFFRLLGLPVFEPAGTFYSPGRNRDSDKKSSFVKFKKIVAAGISNDLYALMDAREININNYLQIFSLSDINASVLALAITQSPLRKFNIIYDNAITDPFNSDKTSQSYSFDNTSNFSGTHLLSDYQDSNGNKPTGKVLGFLSKRSHIIAPLMVDPRVELTVNPPYIGTASSGNTTICKIVGAPFALDKSQLLYIENIYANRPIIETVCRQRLNISQPQSKLSQRFQDIITYIKNADLVNDSNLLDKVVQNSTEAREDTILTQYINIMRAMIDKLVESLHIISDTELDYHWVPIPDKKGPEFGSTTQGIVIGDDLNSNIDNTIINAIVSNEVDQINSQSSKTTQTDLGNFIDIQVQPSPDAQSTDAVENRAQNELDNMIRIRDEKSAGANEALRTIEIIMGEFSGLGFADIIAIYLALWTIDQNALVGMLDNESFARLVQIKELQSPAVLARHNNNDLPIEGFDIVTVMTSFEQQVSEIYKLMDKLVLDRLTNNGAGNL